MVSFCFGHFISLTDYKYRMLCAQSYRHIWIPFCKRDSVNLITSSYGNNLQITNDFVSMLGYRHGRVVSRSYFIKYVAEFRLFNGWLSTMVDLSRIYYRNVFIKFALCHNGCICYFWQPLKHRNHVQVKTAQGFCHANFSSSFWLFPYINFFFFE